MVPGVAAQARAHASPAPGSASAWGRLGSLKGAPGSPAGPGSAPGPVGGHSRGAPSPLARPPQCGAGSLGKPADTIPPQDMRRHVDTITIVQAPPGGREPSASAPGGHFSGSLARAQGGEVREAGITGPTAARQPLARADTLARAPLEVDRRCVEREGGDARVALAGELRAPPPNTVQRAHGLASLQGVRPHQGRCRGTHARKAYFSSMYQVPQAGMRASAKGASRAV